jgi:hypothetical protein
MATYENNSVKSVFSSVDIDDASNTAFSYVKNEADVDKVKEWLAASGQSIVAQSYVKGHTVIVTQSSGQKEAFLSTLGELDGGAFTPVQPEKPSFLQNLRTHGWKIRGGSSVVGQSMTLFSAFNAVSKVDADAGRLKPKFDPAIGAFAILNLTANFVNYIFGGQKEDDAKGLTKFDAIIADEVNRYLPDNAPKVLPAEVRKLSYMDDAQMAEHNKDRSPAGVIKRNSVRLGEVGLRTLGSLCMVFNYKKVLPAFKQLSQGEMKQAFLTAKVEDRATFLAGCGMVAGKIMGLFAKTNDPNDPPKTYIEEIRQKVLWTTSSFTEMLAQSSVAYDRSKNKRLVIGGVARPDVTGVAGNVLLTVPPYPTRLVLPYGKKVLDVDEVQARLLDELPKLPRDKIPEVVARVTARMVEHMGDSSPSFSELYKNILKKLETYHHIDACPQATPPAAEQNTHFAEKIGRKTTNPIHAIINRDAVDLPLSAR